MKQATAERIAAELIRQHCPAGWCWDWDRARKRFGQCRYGPMVISLSLPLTLANNEATFRQVVLHEIAHVKAGPKAGHGRVWKAHAMALGIDPNRCWDTDNDDARLIEAGGYIGTCPNCGRKTRMLRMGKRMRERRLACGPCCKRYNHGYFSSAYAYTWRKAPRRRTAA